MAIARLPSTRGQADPVGFSLTASSSMWKKAARTLGAMCVGLLVMATVLLVVIVLGYLATFLATGHFPRPNEPPPEVQ